MNVPTSIDPYALHGNDHADIPSDAIIASMRKWAELCGFPIVWVLVALPADTDAIPAYLGNMSLQEQISVLESHIDNLRRRLEAQ